MLDDRHFLLHDFPLRLHDQQLIDTQLAKVEDVVYWLGAVQARDFAAAKWALARRAPSATEVAAERAFNKERFCGHTCCDLRTFAA
jgi:hypothetical protein